MSLRAAIPILPTKDAQKSVAFWVDVVGFEKLWEHQFEPGFPLYVGVRMGPVELHLNEHDDSGAKLSLFFSADGLAQVDALHSAMAARGLDAEAPQDQEWGVRSFSFTDPDGHEITIGCDLPGFDETRTG